MILLGWLGFFSLVVYLEDQGQCLLLFQRGICKEHPGDSKSKKMVQCSNYNKKST